jgi:hypothetical protein
MAPPVEQLGEQHAGHERGPDDHDRSRALSTSLALLRPLPEL